MNGPFFSRASQLATGDQIESHRGPANCYNIADFTEPADISDLANRHFAIDTDREGVADRGAGARQSGTQQIDQSEDVEQT